ncbi:MAG TPA: cytochrome P450 [Acidimicrobiales bacterium]|nr:cytochrome P450 [Acidimicrobiales bacterium]
MGVTADATEPEGLISSLLETPEGRRDPYPLYRRLRARAPVHRGQYGLVLSRYDDCLRVLKDPGLGKGLRDARGGPPPMGGGSPEADGEVASMLDLDPPAHTRQRRLVSRAFTPRRVEALRPAVGRMVEGLVDRLADAGEADVMRELAFPLPVTVIGELMGVPEADRAGFQPLVRDAAATLEVAVDDETWARARRARATMASYFRDLMAERRARPGDDLLTALVSAPERDDRLGEPEVVATTLLLFGAGFETTTNLIGNGLLALLRHPQEAGRLGADPSRELVASTVEELLRWDSPVQLDGRMALEEVVVAGHHLVPGDVVLTLLGSANRDPARFVDPERLDLCRTDGGPISFGGGIHYCLGAGLARMEGQVVFGTLARRFAAIELAEEPEWRSGLTLRGLSSLRVRVRSH